MWEYPLPYWWKDVVRRTGISSLVSVDAFHSWCVASTEDDTEAYCKLISCRERVPAGQYKWIQFYTNKVKMIFSRIFFSTYSKITFSDEFNIIFRIFDCYRVQVFDGFDEILQSFFFTSAKRKQNKCALLWVNWAQHAACFEL